MLAIGNAIASKFSNILLLLKSEEKPPASCEQPDNKTIKLSLAHTSP